MLLNLIFGIFIILLIYLFFYNQNNFIIENMENKFQNYDNLENDQKNGPLFLAIKNAANISYINNRLNNLNSLNERFTKIENKVNINYYRIQHLTTQLSKFTTSLGNKK